MKICFQLIFEWVINPVKKRILAIGPLSKIIGVHILFITYRIICCKIGVSDLSCNFLAVFQERRNSADGTGAVSERNTFVWICSSLQTRNEGPGI